MPRAVDVLSRTTFATLATVVTALVVLLAQGPLWMDSVPFIVKLFVVSLAVLSFLVPLKDRCNFGRFDS